MTMSIDTGSPAASRRALRRQLPALPATPANTTSWALPGPTEKD